MTDTEHRVGDWMQTARGGEFWPIDPRADEVDIEDIAHALANICRFNGHCRTFYSVAQHSVLVSENVAPECRLWGLLHDASEAYVCDVPRPLKPYLPGYKDIEKRVMLEICVKFGLSSSMPDDVRRVDSAILADEAAQIMRAPPRQWALPEPPLGITIDPWSTADAKRRFMDAFLRLPPAPPAHHGGAQEPHQQPPADQGG